MPDPMTPERLAEISERLTTPRLGRSMARETDLDLLAIRALLAEVRRLQDAAERVRALHHRVDVGVIVSDCAREECDHEGACPEVPFAVCGACYSIADQIDPYLYERGGVEVVAWPCPTVQTIADAPSGADQ